MDIVVLDRKPNFCPSPSLRQPFNGKIGIDGHALNGEIVAQVSFSWKQLYCLLLDSALEGLDLRVLRPARKSGGWLLGAIALSVLLAWNWQLILATTAGIGVMIFVYLLLGWNWQAWWSRWRTFFQGSQGKLALAVGSGGLAALSTYIGAAIWAEAENRWLAAGAILQGLATFLVLVLSVWQAITQQERQEENQFEGLLGNLTGTDSLKRLIAVRRLARLAEGSRFSRNYQGQLQEYFCLMLQKEPEPLVRQAILEVLQSWEPRPLRLSRTSSQPGQPLHLSLKQKQTLKIQR